MYYDRYSTGCIVVLSILKRLVEMNRIGLIQDGKFEYDDEFCSYLTRLSSTDEQGVVDFSTTSCEWSFREWIQ